MNYLSAALLVLAYFAFLAPAWVRVLRQGNRTGNVFLIGVLAVPYLLASLPTVQIAPYDFASGLVRMLIYLFLPGLLLIFRPVDRKPLDLFDLAAIACLWFPIEFGWLPKLPVPITGSIYFPIPAFTGVLLGFLLFLVIRPLSRIGYTLALQWRGLLLAGQGLLFVLGMGIPISLAMGFVHFGFPAFSPGAWPLRFLAIYFLTAIPEELLFRGCIQNLLEERFGRNGLTLISAAAIFGVSHLNNTTAYHVPPNWPYMVVATLAGLGYGWVWRKSGKITVSALTHALVNFIWSIAFLK